MSDKNVPNDWNNFWTTCATCGYRWHLSEGNSCDVCAQKRKEWLENHCVLCKTIIYRDEKVYPHDEDEEDACVCLSCEAKEGGIVCHWCEELDNEVIGYREWIQPQIQLFKKASETYTGLHQY